MGEREVRYWYPPEWRDEFLRTGTVKIWSDHYPELGDGSRGIHNPFPKDESNLSTYALMYLLRRDEGVHSLTYFRLTCWKLEMHSISAEPTTGISKTCPNAFRVIEF